MCSASAATSSRLGSNPGQISAPCQSNSSARGEWPRAAACYENAVALAPGDTEALGGLVGSLVAAGNRAAARHHNQALEKLDPEAARVFDEALGE